jgi:hypothetical protein
MEQLLATQNQLMQAVLETLNQLQPNQQAQWVEKKLVIAECMDREKVQACGIFTNSPDHFLIG